MSNQQTQSGEGGQDSDQPTAYFGEVSGLRERYDSHILPADYKYKVGTLLRCWRYYTNSLYLFVVQYFGPGNIVSSLDGCI